MKYADYKNILKGVSTLDVMRRNLKAILFLIILTAFSVNVFGGHSTLDIVDPNFNPQVQSNLYSLKWVNEVQVLPDGKLLVLGSFNSYNRVPVGKLVRLNADGLLDTTFNNQTVTAVQFTNSSILVQPNGKIVLRSVGLVAGNQGPKPLLRLNADGTFDSSFNFTQTNLINRSFMDSLGRLLLMGDFTTPNGARRIVRLNDDGSLDNSFNFTLPAGAALQNMAMQGDKLIVITDVSNNRRIYRLNEDGSEDVSFTPFNGTLLGLHGVQPGNKIVYGMGSALFRLNENGGSDATFQPIDISNQFGALLLKFTGGGKLVTITQGSPATFKRYLPDGAVDSSFTQYMTTFFASYTILANDSIVMGDSDLFSTGSNNFIRLTPGGTVDPTFNPGGDGFKTVQPGIIQAIQTYPDGKILLGGRFDIINDVLRYRLARLNADSSIDTSFQVNTTSGSGNYFSIIRDIYQIRRQPDGKLVVSGFFDYVLNGVTKQNFVRLNSDGSIDPTFNLTYPIPDESQINFSGQNPFQILSDGKLMVGTLKRNTTPVRYGPVRLATSGDLDTSFNSTLNNTSFSVHIHDIAIQPDGKILVSGTHELTPGGGFNAFVGRLNTDGSLDSSFSHPQEPGRKKSRLALLPDGKILVTKNLHPNAGSAKVQRLNSNGSVDNSFNTVSLSDPTASLNALLVLPNGKIFVGGRFTLTINGQPGKNLLQLDADGNFEPTVYNLNEEVLTLAMDSEGRVLVGGVFTVISTNGGAGEVRSYVARLTDSRARFDYDGDGKADISVFRPAENKWYILQSSNSAVVQTIFAVPGDIPTPADFDGDGKTDVAIFRPSLGDWWYLSSITNAQVNVHWGQAGDIPRPSDFDGDGKTDFVVYRPSNSVWYRLGTTGVTSIIAFGLAEDKPLVGDFDGDGKSDLAVFRPSTGAWWYASSSNGQFAVVQWGTAGDIPVPGDYDGDGKTDFVVFRPSDGGWYILYSTGSYTIATFGTVGDKPVAADYDGDGKADVAVFRPSTGTWYLLQTTAGFGAMQWGASGDIPTENAFLP